LVIGGGQRIVFVCNRDLVNEGKDFTERDPVTDEKVTVKRDAVFVLENISGKELIHSISSARKTTDNISYLSMSKDGATLAFQDEKRGNAYRLLGLSRLLNKKEVTINKRYPEALQLPGDGESGSLIFINCLLMFSFGYRLKKRKVSNY